MHILNSPHIGNLGSISPEESKEANKAVFRLMMGYGITLWAEFVMKNLTHFTEPKRSVSCQDKALALRLITFNGVNMSFSNISHIDCSHLYPWASARQVVIHKHGNEFCRREITRDEGGSDDKGWINDGQLDSFIFRLSCDKVPSRPFGKRLALLICTYVWPIDI